MSVQYIPNKKIKIGDLKKAGFKVEERKEWGAYPFFITSECGSGVGVSKVFSDGERCKTDDLIVSEFSGQFSHGGGRCMLEICDKLGCKFVTDEDIDELLYTKDDDDDTIYLTDELFEFRTKKFMELFLE